MKFLKILIILVILIGGGIAVSRLLHPESEAQAAGAPPNMPPVPVPVVVMQEAPVQLWKSFPGRLEAVDLVELRPQVSGTIKQIKFEDGQMVNKGDILFVIDPSPYEAEVAQAKADAQAAKNQYELAQKELARAEELIGTGAIPKRTYDERLSNQLVAKSAIASSEARVKRAQLNLDYAYVKAPISGRTSRAEITEGNLVEAGPGAPVLTTIVSSEGIYAGFEVDEQTYLRYVRGTVKDHDGEKKIPVKLTLQGDNGMVFDGYIHSFDNRIDASSGTIRARAYFENEDGALLPGMFISVSIGSAETQNMIMVPQRAIGTDQSRKFVYVVSPEKKVTYREVSLGDVIGDSRVVLSGLQPGDQVITDGLMKLRPDMIVDPQVQAAPAPEATAPAEAAPLTEEPPQETQAEEAQPQTAEPKEEEPVELLQPTEQ